MTFLALIAIIFFGFAVYNLTCAFVDIPTKKTSQMMMLSRKQQGTKNEKLLDVYVTKIAGWIAPYLRLDRLKRNKGPMQDRKAVRRIPHSGLRLCRFALVREFYF